MNRQLTRMQRGMTLIEMLITISLLGGVMASTLTLYSKIMKTNRQRDTLATMIADADRILATIEQDIRNAASIDTQYALAGTYAVIAALPRVKNGGTQPAQTIVYAFDAAQPQRLLRLRVADDVYATELAVGVKSFTMLPDPNTLTKVDVILERIVAGETKTWQASTAFSALAMK